MSAEKEGAGVDLGTRVIVGCTGLGGRLPRPGSRQYHPVRAMSRVREGIGSDTAARHPDPTEFGVSGPTGATIAGLTGRSVKG
jgi:hypothetical protein